ncbi:MAG TPA: HAD family phosphatase [Chitinophagales bacterium]|nr:HAD family phosphatase [Chitinophagales bacterium]
MKAYKNLIFDIGDVLIDIDYKATIAEFQKLAVVDFGTIVSYNAQNPVFDLFETGKITAAQFRDELRQFLRPGTTDEQIDVAWNAILIDYPAYKLDLLNELKSRYNTFALSNINEIHVNTINQEVKRRFGIDSFSTLFHYACYSNEVGHRKPDKEIYKLILDRENLIPGETFFVDDKAENVEAAKELGIQAVRLTDRDKLKELLAAEGIL